ncbi:MAG: glycosyltransferase family 39 protein [Candidatus Woesearchaeota archaeon]
MKRLKQSKSSKSNKFLSQIKSSFWIIILILFLAAIVRIVDISNESYWVDEILTIRQGQATASTLNLYLEGEMHMPLYIFLMWGWIHIFGISEIATRIFSAIFGIFSVYIIYLIGKKLFNKKIGIYSSLILALSPIAVYYSQEARLYSMFMFIVLLSFYTFILYLEKGERKYLIWYIIINILMLYTNIFAFVVLGIHALWVLIKNRLRLKEIVIALAISVLSLIPIIMRIAVQYSNFDKSDKSWLLPSIDKIIMMLIHYAGGIGLLIVECVIIILGIFFCRRKNKVINNNINTKNYTTKKTKNYNTKNKTGNTDAENKNNILILIAWAIIPIIMVFILSIIQPLYHERYLLFTLPAYILIISFYISEFKYSYQKILIILIILLSSYSLIIQHQNVDKDNWRSVSKFLKDNVKEDDYLLITPYYHQESLTYYYNSQCFEEIFMEHCNFVTKKIITINIGQNCCNSNTLVVDNNKFGDLLAKDDKLWLIQNRVWINNNATPYNYINTQKKLVSKHTFDAGFNSEIEVYEFE